LRTDWPPRSKAVSPLALPAPCFTPKKMTNVIFYSQKRAPMQYMGMKKPSKRTTLKEDAGKYLLDVSKLVFGSIVLSGILRREHSFTFPSSLVILSPDPASPSRPS